MFCSKCGNSLEDSARFCDKCGAATMANNDNTPNVATKIVDNEVQLSIKPKFKSIYFMWSTYLFIAGVMLLCVLLSIGSLYPWATIIEGLVVCVVALVIKLISLIFKKKQIANMKYDFYKTKIEYSDSFLDKVEKEVKYKYIRECVLSRTISDRIFGFGRIILFTNAETGYANGILIPYLENSETVYRQIKELIDD